MNTVLTSSGSMQYRAKKPGRIGHLTSRHGRCQPVKEARQLSRRFKQARTVARVDDRFAVGRMPEVSGNIAWNRRTRKDLRPLKYSNCRQYPPSRMRTPASRSACRGASDGIGSGRGCSDRMLCSSSTLQIENYRRLRIAGRRSEEHHLASLAECAPFHALMQCNRDACGHEVAIVGHVAMKTILRYVNPPADHFEGPGGALMRNDVDPLGIDVRAVHNLPDHRRKELIRRSHQDAAVHAKSIARLVFRRIVEDGQQMAPSVDRAGVEIVRTAFLREDAHA